MSYTRVGFRVQALYKVKKQSAAHFARQKLSFMVAVLSLMAFVMGNMVGQHGWYAFWKSVLGKGEDTMIVFTGTVPPVEWVPDYAKWATYGGDPEQHEFRMVPKDILVRLPEYDPVVQRGWSATNPFATVYSVGNLGDYKSGADHAGSHIGMDIRLPVGTPIVAIANGFVEKVSRQKYGYGHYVMIRHPNVPDRGSAAGTTTTVYSVYAHLDSIMVSEGEAVRKGQKIATSGKTGFASGPHLHFQIDLASAPFHPYWAFTTAEATKAGYSFNDAINNGLHQARGELYTTSPMLFVQQYLNTSTLVASNAQTSPTEGVAVAPVKLSTKEMAAKRRGERAARLPVVIKPPVPVAIAPDQPVPSMPEVVVGTPVQEASLAEPQKPASIIVGANTDVDRLEIVHNAKSTRSWQKIQIRALDRNGELVRSPSFDDRLYIIATFGEAEFRPNELSPIDFVNGVAIVNVLPRGNKTLNIETRGAFSAVSEPLVVAR